MVSPAHRLAPGLHVPVHAPPTQALAHGVPSIQWPVASQVCGIALLHPMSSGEHCPLHTPVPGSHAWFTQGTGALHCPLSSHVWTPLPEHFDRPGTQTPVHAPLTQADATHAVDGAQFPMVSQVSTPLVCEQRVFCGSQVPVHCPETQAWSEHVTPS